MTDLTELNVEEIPGFKRTLELEVESHDGREQDFLDFIKARTADQPRPVPVKTLLELTDEFSWHNHFLISIGHQKATVFAQTIRDNKPKTYIELGGYLGYSALLAASTMREHAQDAHVWSVEMDATCARIMSEIVNLAGLDDCITIVNASSTDAIVKMQEKGAFKNVDMLFLDHDEQRYPQDLRLYLESDVIGTGSVVLADNVIRPGAPEYLAYVRHHEGLDSHGVLCYITPGNFKDEIEITKIVDATKALEQ